MFTNWICKFNFTAIQINNKNGLVHASTRMYSILPLHYTHTNNNHLLVTQRQVTPTVNGKITYA